MTDKEKETQEKVEAPTLSVKEALEKLESYPGQAQVEKWKKQYGEAFCSGFTEQEIYIWRPVNRLEWNTLQRSAAEVQSQGNDFDMELELVKQCVLWASDQDSFVKKAGTVSSLFEQVMARSNFVSPQVSHMLIEKL